MAERLDKVYPFVGVPQQRDRGTRDQRYVNVLFELIPNQVAKEQVVYCNKRPGISTAQTPGVAVSTGRGIYSWMGTTHAEIGNKLWCGPTSTALNTSSGRVWFTETHVDTGQRLLIACDGLDNYNNSSTNSTIRIDEATHTNYPVSSLGPILTMDGFLFMSQSNGRIWNTPVNSFSSWTADKFLTADTHGGDLEAIYMQKDQITAFTKNRVEFFFNNGNPTGSPLLRIDQNTIYVGLSSKETLAWFGEMGCFVGENAESGRSVYQMASLKMGEISTPVINRFLTAEGLSISSATAWMAPVAGQLIYCLNLQSANRSFVFGVDTNLWAEWTGAAGGRFNCVSAAYRDGTTYLQDVSSGQIHQISTSLFADNASSFTVTLQTPRQNFGTPFRKFERELSIIGDRTLGHISTSWSDDDYESYSGTRNIDMSLQRKRTSRLGSFYERAHRFEYASASSLRIQAYIPHIERGSR